MAGTTIDMELKGYSREEAIRFLDESLSRYQQFINSPILRSKIMELRSPFLHWKMKRLMKKEQATFKRKHGLTVFP